MFRRRYGRYKTEMQGKNQYYIDNKSTYNGNTYLFTRIKNIRYIIFGLLLKINIINYKSEKSQKTPNQIL